MPYFAKNTAWRSLLLHISPLNELHLGEHKSRGTQATMAQTNLGLLPVELIVAVTPSCQFKISRQGLVTFQEKAPHQNKCDNSTPSAIPIPRALAKTNKKNDKRGLELAVGATVGASPDSLWEFAECAM